MRPPSRKLYGISLKDVGALEPLLPGLAGPFWRAGPPAKSAADYADGLEDLITNYYQQDPAQLISFLKQLKSSTISFAESSTGQLSLVLISRHEPDTPLAPE